MYGNITTRQFREDIDIHLIQSSKKVGIYFEDYRPVCVLLNVHKDFETLIQIQMQIKRFCQDICAVAERA